MVLSVPSNRRHMVPYASAVGVGGKNFDISAKNYENPPKWLRKSSQNNALPNTCFMSVPRIKTQNEMYASAEGASEKVMVFWCKPAKSYKIAQKCPQLCLWWRGVEIKSFGQDLQRNFWGATTHPRADFASSLM